MRDYLPEITVIIVIVSLSAAIIFGIYKASIKHDDKNWNNGHCDICGGAWQYEQAVGHRSSASYIYVCENCGKRIELFERFQNYDGTRIKSGSSR